MSMLAVKLIDLEVYFAELSSLSSARKIVELS
jgi:hypothetical protein